MQEGLVAKEALAGEIMENEMTKVVKETSVRQTLGPTALSPNFVDTAFLKWFG